MAVPILPPYREFQPIRTFMSFSLLRLRESPSLKQEMAAARRPNELLKTEKTKNQQPCNDRLARRRYFFGSGVFTVLG
jgi:hypothetical protein